MSYQSINIPEPLLISPPLYPPLVLRTTKNGMFGAKRQGESQWGPCQPCTRFEPALGVNQDYVKWQIHEGIDLEWKKGGQSLNSE